jgi:hypothetical protein
MGTGDYAALPTVFENRELQDMTLRVSDLRTQDALLGATFSADYPKRQQLQSQIAEAQKALDQERGRAATQIEDDYLAAVRRETMLQQAFSAAQRDANEIAEKSVEYNILKLAVELGVPAAACLIAFLFWMAGRIARASQSARSSLLRAQALGSFGAITAMLVHALADFNFYIPANALVFSVVLGLGTAISLIEPPKDAVPSADLAAAISALRAVALESLSKPEAPTGTRKHENHEAQGVAGSDRGSRLS